MLILFRRPHADEFLDRRWAASKTMRQPGRVPGEVHLREQRRLDRRVGSAREWTMPAGVRAERVQRQELVTGPVRLGCRLLVPGEQGLQVRFKRRPEVEILLAAWSTHQACLYEVDRFGVNTGLSHRALFMKPSPATRPINSASRRGSSTRTGALTRDHRPQAARLREDVHPDGLTWGHPVAVRTVLTCAAEAEAPAGGPPPASADSGQLDAVCLRVLPPNRRRGAT